MKPWAGDIERHIQKWSHRLGHRCWWPRYVYHFTDVRNAANILTSGCLVSRVEAQQQGRMLVDNASPVVIGGTKAEHLKYVRLYFRPRTPTQFCNEGIRPIGERVLGGAHCPVPVYFCFDALEVLARDDTEFSTGNMGSAHVLHGTARELFLNIPFDKVFHDGAFRDDEKTEIIFRRNAEVLVPNRLELAPALRFVACRTAAERQTLLHLLQADSRHSWSPSVRLGEGGLFERHWTFVEDVVAVNDTVIFRFNPDSRTPGPFDTVFSYQEDGGERVRSWKGRVPALNSQFSFRLPGAHSGSASLYLDDALAYSGPITFEELPF